MTPADAREIALKLLEPLGIFKIESSPFFAPLIDRITAALLSAGLPQTQAARDVLAERARQVSGEGWTPTHDDEHVNCELVRAAAMYAINASLDEFPADDAPTLHAIMEEAMEHLWPWAASWWKPKDRRRDLVRAGALILAEIERLDRASLSSSDSSSRSTTQ